MHDASAEDTIGPSTVFAANTPSPSSAMLKFSATSLANSDVLLIKSHRFQDARGYFAETYSESEFASFGIETHFVQDNHSMSTARGTVRGLHFQTPPYPQSKLVRVIKGAIFDVAVDLRKGSPLFGNWFGARLDADSGEQIFIPRGFAHGFCTLQPQTEVIYKVDNSYSAECESGLFWADPDISIDWPISDDEAILSDKDKKLPTLSQFRTPFAY